MKKRKLKSLTVLLLVCALLISYLPGASVYAADSASAAAQASSEEASAGQNSPLLDQTVTLGDVAVRLEAAPGVFPKGASLFAERVPISEQREVEAAVETERSATRNVAVSYTFDIKVLAQDGTELQPSDANQVKISFTLAEVENQNLETQIYHVTEDAQGDLNVESLAVETQGDTATVLTDGFSYYTVEFTYGEKQFVLTPDDGIYLSQILSAVGLEGAVTEVQLSDPNLIGLFYEAEHSDYWLTSLKPFTTQEWLRVSINGVQYEIVLTDAIVSDSSVSEGKFARQADLATCYIDRAKITAANAVVLAEGLLDGVGDENKSIVAKNVTATRTTRTDFLDVGNFTVTYADAVVMSDGHRENLIITVTGVKLAFRTDIVSSFSSDITVFWCQGQDGYSSNGRPSFVGKQSAGSSGEQVGLYYDNAVISVGKSKSTHNYLNDTFFFTSEGINVNRRGTQSNFQNSFGNLYGADDNYCYTETVRVNSGVVGDIYLPTDGLEFVDNTTFIGGQTNPSFNPEIPKTASNYQYINGGNNGNYNSGFAALAQASSGISLTAWQSAPKSSSVTDLYILMDQITYTITSSSSYNGMIETWRSGAAGGHYAESDTAWLYGGRKGYDPLSDTTANEPRVYDVPCGKTVTYRMYPEEGYVLNSLTVTSNDATTYTVVYRDGHTETVAIGSEPTLYTDSPVDYYEYTFPGNINYDNDQSIHVTWKPAVTLNLEKLWDDQGNAFKLRPSGVDMTLTDPSGTVSAAEKTVTLNAGNNWSHTWYNLPKYASYDDTTGAGTNLYAYAVVETVPSYYTEVLPHVVEKSDAVATAQYWAKGNAVNPNYWDFDETAQNQYIKGRVIDYKIVNRLDVGGLVVEKDTVPDDDSAATFVFTVTLKHAAADLSSMGTPGSSVHEVTRSVTLTGESLSALIGPLPKGTTYTVAETTVPNGWKLIDSSGISGEILVGDFYAYNVGSELYIKHGGGYVDRNGVAKTLPINATPALASDTRAPAATYYFDKLGIRISGDNSGTYLYGTNNHANVQAVLPEALPGWKVSYAAQSVAEGQFVLHKSNNAKASDCVIGYAVDCARFTNIKLVDLSIGKEVVGNQASRDKYFKYRVKLEIDTAQYGENKDFKNHAASVGLTNFFSGAGGTVRFSVEGNYDPVTGSNLATISDNAGKPNPTELTFPALSGGKASVEFELYLQHGQIFTVKDLPCGLSYTVTEIPEDYRPGVSVTGDERSDDAARLNDPSLTGAGSSILTGTPVGFNQSLATDTCLIEDTMLTFFNTRDGVIPTGVSDFTMAPALILLLLAGILSLLLLMGRRRLASD